jgi:CHAD domain-containing protein
MGQAKVLDVATRAIADGVARLTDSEAKVRTGGQDIVEAVHQMRVATRRLRSDLRTFGGALEQAWAQDLRAELAWLAAPLGASRDADVLAQRLIARLEKLEALETSAAAQLVATLEAQQRSARTTLLAELDGERHHALREHLEWAAGVPRPGPSADRPASKELPQLVRRSCRRLERRVDSLGGHPSDAQLHAVRIAAKRCRYAAEACSPWLGKPTRRLARMAKRLQEVLGELNDAVVARAWLEQWALQTPSTQGEELAHTLAKLERAAARRARKRWPKAWERVASAAPG